MLEADVLDPANICEGDGAVSSTKCSPSSAASPTRAGRFRYPPPARSRPGGRQVTNVGDDPVEVRDIDSEGLDVISGRPVLAPGETLTLTGVDVGTVLLQAYEPGSDSELVGPRIERTVDCGP